MGTSRPSASATGSAASNMRPVAIVTTTPASAARRTAATFSGDTALLLGSIVPSRSDTNNLTAITVSLFLSPHSADKAPLPML